MNKNWLPLVVAVAVAVALVVGFGAGVAIGVPESASGIADWITAIAAVLALALGYITIRRQQHEAVQQRQMETVQWLDGEYDAIGFDIQKLYGDLSSGGETRSITPEQEEYFYRRFFIALENCQRRYQRGLVPRTEYRNWTCSLVSRFGTHLYLVLNPGATLTFEDAWAYHRLYSLGDKREFNAYMDAVLELSRAEPWASAKAAAAVSQQKQFTKPVALSEDQHDEIRSACDAIVDRVPLVWS
jgi:hypothetical protein